MNIEDLKEMVENCVYEEENLVCMSSEYYQKIIKNAERLNKKLENLEKLNNANYQSFIETNKIIIELEKWLRNEYSKYNGAIRIANVLDKIKELKGSDKE